MYYTASIKNQARDSATKRTSAGRGSLGVSASAYLDTQAEPIVGVEMWLRDFSGEPKLQVSAIGNGHDVCRSGPMLFDGSIEEFVELLSKEG